MKRGDRGLLGLTSSDWHVGVGGPSSLLKELSVLASLTLTSPPGLRAAPSPVGPDSAVPAIPVSSLQLVPSPAAPGTLPQPPPHLREFRTRCESSAYFELSGQTLEEEWCRLHDSPWVWNLLCPSSIP